GPGPVHPDVQHRSTGLRGDRPAADGRGVNAIADGAHQRQGSEAKGHPAVGEHGGASTGMASPDRSGTGVAPVPERPRRPALPLRRRGPTPGGGAARGRELPNAEGSADLSPHPAPHNGDAPATVGSRYHSDRALVGARGDGDDAPVYRGEPRAEGAGPRTARG